MFDRILGVLFVQYLIHVSSHLPLVLLHHLLAPFVQFGLQFLKSLSIEGTLFRVLKRLGYDGQLSLSWVRSVHENRWTSFSFDALVSRHLWSVEDSLSHGQFKELENTLVLWLSHL